MPYQAPTKSPYGDELLDDTWSPPNTPPQKSQNYQPGLGQAPLEASQNVFSNSNQTQSSVKELFSSLTQEDILFMRTWQKDCLFSRVIPLTAVSCGTLFLYNRSKQLPQSISRYLFLASGAYVVGRMSFRGELKRRAAESPSNTPYMRELRRVMGVNQVASMHGFGGNFGDSSGAPGSELSGWADSDVSSVTQPYNFAAPLNNDRHPSDSSELPYGSEPPKQATSYEELRARNRGYIK